MLDRCLINVDPIASAIYDVVKEHDNDVTWSCVASPAPLLVQACIRTIKFRVTGPLWGEWTVESPHKVPVITRKTCPCHDVIMTPVTCFIEEVNPRLAKCLLVFNGRLAYSGLTSLVKEVKVCLHRKLCSLRSTCTQRRISAATSIEMALLPMKWEKTLMSGLSSANSLIQLARREVFPQPRSPTMARTDLSSRVSSRL